MNLHYSQTIAAICFLHSVVLLPYEFTLFSNLLDELLRISGVLLPYEFTLFSNTARHSEGGAGVLLPYEFTLFSNLVVCTVDYLKFYYLMNLHYSQTLTRFHSFLMKFYYLMNLHYSQTA